MTKKQMNEDAVFINRRTLLKSGLAVGALSMFSGCVTSDVGSGLRVREDLLTYSQDPAKVEALRAAVRKLKERPISDPTSWMWQANIHGAKGFTPTTSLEKDCWNSCPHGGYLFFPWHRAYLYWLEQIMIDAIDDKSFALPYWNYTVDTYKNLQMPGIYRLPADASNSLWNDRRFKYTFKDSQKHNLSIDVGNGSPMLWKSIDPTDAFKRDAFCTIMGENQNSLLVFGSQQTKPGPMQDVHLMGGFGALEDIPHNYVHDMVGGTKDGADGDMADINTAGRDPIFYAHHSNIDRLWSSWIAADPRNHLDPTGEEGWMSQKMYFVAPDGSRVEEQPANLLVTEGRLNYRYDSLYIPAPHKTTSYGTHCVDSNMLVASAQAKLLSEPALTLKAGGDRASIKLQLKKSPEKMMQSIAPSNKEQGPVTLIIEGVETTMEPMSAAVFINLPKGGKPSFEDPHFVGLLTIFGIAGSKMKKTFSKAFSIDDELKELAEKGLYDGGDIEVTIFSDNKNPIKIKAVHIQH